MASPATKPAAMQDFVDVAQSSNGCNKIKDTKDSTGTEVGTGECCLPSGRHVKLIHQAVQAELIDPLIVELHNINIDLRRQTGQISSMIGDSSTDMTTAAYNVAGEVETAKQSTPSSNGNSQSDCDMRFSTASGPHSMSTTSGGVETQPQLDIQDNDINKIHGQ